MARSEPRAAEEASSYVTEEFESGLTLSKRAERGEAEEASPNHSERATDGSVPSGVLNAEIGISDGFEIPATVVAGGSPTVVQETRVFRQYGSAAEEASRNSIEASTDGTVTSEVEETSLAVVVGGSPTVVPGTGSSQTTTRQRRIREEDMMPYAYPKYSNHPDAAAHVKQFRSIWAVNHGTQGLSPTEREQS